MSERAMSRPGRSASQKHSGAIPASRAFSAAVPGHDRTQSASSFSNLQGSISGGMGSIPVAQFARKNKKSAKKEAKRREAAINRRERDDPYLFDPYASDKIDPVVAENLRKLDRLHPRKTAARRNLARHDPLAVVEVGAGEGRFSHAFGRKFGESYAATDIAHEEGKHGFLGLAGGKKIRRKFQVDANSLGAHFAPKSLDHVVGANPFGVKGTAGASYGLMRETPGGTGRNRFTPDDRFLKGAKPLLKPGGSVDLYGRSNILRVNAVSKVPSTGRKGTRTKAEQDLVAAAKEKFSGENANPYLEIPPADLHTLAKQTGYRVKVKRAKQPRGIISGGNPDTKSGDQERANTGLKPFNTHFKFTPEPSGYQSDDEDPRVDYSSGEESEWED